MLPAVVFFPNALHLQRRKKKSKPNKNLPDLDFFEPHPYSLLFISWNKWK